jgi:hexokinase
MGADLVSLELSHERLARVRDRLAQSIRAGLAKPGQEIKALPAYLRRPKPGISGRAVVLDVGGSKMRAAAVEMTNGEARLLGPIVENEMMQRAAREEVSRDEFFAAQAELVLRAYPEFTPGFTLGYCFSYPATITPQGEAVLIEWTKGIRVADSIGQNVGALLAHALRRRGAEVGRIPVLNDTVASLMAAAAIAPGEDRPVGLIVGTGTNMAGFFPVGEIAKLGDARDGWLDGETMAVNLESGDFSPREILGEWDAALDAALLPEQRGKQRFEKAVSGRYLPRLLWLAAGSEACRKAGFDIEDPACDAARVAGLRTDPIVGAVATALFDRSADLIAAGLAGMIAAFGPSRRVGILGEGGLFLNTPGYQERIAATLQALLPPAREAMFVAAPDHVPANFLGAAAAALSFQAAA